MSAVAPATPGATLPGWAFSYVDTVRFGDLDAMRHLNNVAFLQFFESARIAYITTIVPSHRPTDPDDDWGLIFAECHINYRAPAFFAEAIRTHVRPRLLKRSSVRMEFTMTSETDGRVLAAGWGALVGYDYGAGAACPLPEVLTGVLREHGAEADAEGSG